MLSMSERMSYPLMRAVPDVGGKSPVRIDLQRKEGVNKTRARDPFWLLIFFGLVMNNVRRRRSSWLNIMVN